MSDPRPLRLPDRLHARLLPEGPTAVLARHFFGSLFAFGVLSEEGVEALKRVLLGLLALAIAGGLLLARIFMIKYGELAEAGPDAYALEVVADHAFLMALPMWLVAAAMALVGQSLFPDETDYRILMVEPLSRAVVFAGKLAALLWFGAVIVGGAHAAMVPIAALTLVGAAQSGTLIAATLAFLVSSAAASVFAALAIVAVHGAVVLLAARRRLLAWSGLIRAATVGALIVALPLVTRLPGAADAFATGAWWLPWAPAAWFAGLERWLLGEAEYAGLAARAVAATSIAALVAVAAYVRLYRRFDRVTFQAAPGGAPRDRTIAGGRADRSPVRAAVIRFVTLTIRRSVLHQGLVVGVLAGAGALVLNSLVGADWEVDASRDRTLLWTLLWAPMTMMFLAVPAIRVALSVPQELRANWIFRLTEDVESRAEVSDAGMRTVLALAVAVPVAAMAPLQAWALGGAASAIVLVEAAIGWLFVEWRMAGWDRVPFTCAYLPGKGFVPQMCVKAFAGYVTFTFGTGLLLRAALGSPIAALAMAAIFGGAAAALGWRRRQHARDTALVFEDQMPSDVTPLRLAPD